VSAAKLLRLIVTVVIAVVFFLIWSLVSTATLPNVHYKLTAVNDAVATITYRDGTHDVTLKDVHLPFTTSVSGTRIAVIIARDDSTAPGTSLTCQIHVANVAPIDNSYVGPEPSVECSA
jgi:hypothetical protein